MLTNWVAIFAALAAWVAAWQAFRSAQTSRRAYQLVLEKEKRLQPSLELYLVESYIRQIKELGIRIFVFRIMVTNKSDAVNYLKDLKLFIEHDRKLGPLSNIAIPNEPALMEHLPQGSGNPLYIPCQIPAHAVIGGLAIFRVPKDLLENSRVESYTLKLTDSYDQETELEAILLHEISDEQMVKNGNPDKQ